ncbi:MAG TPA: ATP synthase F1 subunit delta [Roseiflexaceae bacterium]|nr:ATP synthase F1 subunit delta [Roseiflexaceae bacterium]
MSTSEAQVFARALYDSLVGGTLQALRAAAANLDGADVSGSDVEARINAALPADAPREARNFLLTLVREGALGRLPAIVQAFEQYSQGETRAISSEVTSAVDLSEAQQAKIAGDLRQRYGEQIDVRFGVDPSLIGGLIIRVGDQVLDNSLRTRLSAVQRNMLAS